MGSLGCVGLRLFICEMGWARCWYVLSLNFRFGGFCFRIADVKGLDAPLRGPASSPPPAPEPSSRCSRASFLFSPQWRKSSSLLSLSLSGHLLPGPGSHIPAGLSLSSIPVVRREEGKFWWPPAESSTEASAETCTHGSPIRCGRDPRAIRSSPFIFTDGDQGWG